MGEDLLVVVDGCPSERSRVWRREEEMELLPYWVYSHYSIWYSRKFILIVKYHFHSSTNLFVLSICM